MSYQIPSVTMDTTLHLKICERKFFFLIHLIQRSKETFVANWNDNSYKNNEYGLPGRNR